MLCNARPVLWLIRLAACCLTLAACSRDPVSADAAVIMSDMIDASIVDQTAEPLDITGLTCAGDTPGTVLCGYPAEPCPIGNCHYVETGDNYCGHGAEAGALSEYACDGPEDCSVGAVCIWVDVLGTICTTMPAADDRRACHCDAECPTTQPHCTSGFCGL